MTNPNENTQTASSPDNSENQYQMPAYGQNQPPIVNQTANEPPQRVDQPAAAQGTQLPQSQDTQAPVQTQPFEQPAQQPVQNQVPRYVKQPYVGQPVTYQQQPFQSPQYQQNPQGQQYVQPGPPQNFGQFQQNQYWQQQQFMQQPQYFQQGGPYANGQHNMQPYPGYPAVNMPQPPLDMPWYKIPFNPAVKRFFDKYAVFSGRASLGEFWWPLLLIWSVNLILSFLSLSFQYLGLYLEIVWQVLVFLPLISVTCRRIHDGNASGWWTLLPTLLTFGGSVLTYSSLGLLLSEYATTNLDSLNNTIIVSLGFGSICWIAGLLVWLFFGLRQSNPLGARFDKNQQNPWPQA